MKAGEFICDMITDMGSVANQTVQELKHAVCFFDICIASICIRKPFVILRKHSIVYNCSEAKISKTSVSFSNEIWNI